MSGIVVVSPLLLAAPAVLAAATAAASSLGFQWGSQKLEALQPVEPEERVVGFDVAEAEGLRQLLQERGPLLLTRADATISLRARGQAVCMEVRGKGSQEELESLGQEFLQTVSQHYAYDRVMSDLRQRGFEALEETVDEDGTIRLRLRRWDS